jgi:hypothetical protein
MRPLHYGPGAASELVAAIVAKEHSGLGFPGHAMNVERAAMRAANPVRPARGFYMLAGGAFIVEVLGGKVRYLVYQIISMCYVWRAKSRA